MAISTFSELKTSLADWSARSDLTSIIPDFIMLTEAALNNGEVGQGVEPLRTRQMETTATTAPSSGSITLASDFLEMRRVTYASDPRRKLEYASPEWLDEAYPTSASGDPAFYTIIGSTLSIRPTGTSSIEYAYYAKIAALSDSAPTNWLLTKAPTIYLYGGLYFFSIYNKNPEAASSYLTLFRGAIDGFIRSESFNRAGSFSMRAGTPAP